MTDASSHTDQTPSGRAATHQGRYRLSIRRLLGAGLLLSVVVLFFSYQRIVDELTIRKIDNLLDNYQITEAKEIAQNIQPDRRSRVLLTAIKALRMADDLDSASGLLRSLESNQELADRVRTEQALIRTRLGKLGSPPVEIPRLLANPEMDSRDVCEAYVVGFRLNRSFDQAALLIQAWKRDWPEDPRPWFHEGLIKQMLTNWESAIDAYAEVLKRGIDWPLTHRQMGQCYSQIDDHPKAIAAFRVALKESATDVDSWIGLGNSLRAVGKQPEARAAFLKALEQDASHFLARLSIAEIDFDADRVESAATDLNALLAIWPEDSRALQLRCRIAGRKGDNDEAGEFRNQWRIADQTVQKVEEKVTVLADSPERVDLQIEIGLGLLHHYSRDMGRQYLIAALLMDPSQQEAKDGLALDEKRRQQIRDLPLPAPIQPVDSKAHP